MTKVNASAISVGLAVLPVLVQAVGFVTILVYFNNNSVVAIASALGGILFFEATKSRVYAEINKLRAIWGILSKIQDGLTKMLSASDRPLSKDDYERVLEEELVIGDGGLNSKNNIQAATASGVADAFRSTFVVALHFFIAYHCVILASLFLTT